MRRNSQKSFKEDLLQPDTPGNNDNSKCEGAEEERKSDIGGAAGDKGSEHPNMKLLDFKDDAQIKFNEVGLGLINFNFKCVNGAYRGMSFHLAHNDGGQIIGSLDEEENKDQDPILIEESKENNDASQEKNGAEYLKIEQCGLSPQHCQIQYYQANCFYTIRDLSHKYQQS